MKQPLIKLMLLLAILPSVAFAQHNGTGNGRGRLVDGKLRLHDLVTVGKCDWQNGETILTQNPLLNKILDHFAVSNWYAAIRTRREIELIGFCLTDAEINQAGKDTVVGQITENSILLYNDPSDIPLGLRKLSSKEVYIQRGRYQQLISDSPLDAAAFILHEIFHSFMKQNLSSKDYYEKLESLVSTVANLRGDSTERLNLEKAIEKSQIDMPSSSQFFDDQSFLAYAMESYNGRRKMILQHQVTIASLMVPRSFNYLSQLPRADQEELLLVQNNPGDALFQPFCFADDQEVLNTLKAESTANFNIDLYCLTVPGAVERLLKNPKQIESSTIQSFLKTFYAGLSQVTPKIRNGRVTVSKELDWLSGNPAIHPRYRYALEMKAPFTPQVGEMAESHLLQYSRILIASALVMPVDQWLTFVSQNGSFAMAFDFKRLQASLAQIHSPFEDEDAQALRELKHIYTSALQGILDQLRDHYCDDKATAFTQLIQESNLGLEINHE